MTMELHLLTDLLTHSEILDISYFENVGQLRENEPATSMLIEFKNGQQLRFSSDMQGEGFAISRATIQVKNLAPSVDLPLQNQPISSEKPHSHLAKKVEPSLIEDCRVVKVDLIQNRNDVPIGFMAHLGSGLLIFWTEKRRCKFNFIPL